MAGTLTATQVRSRGRGISKIRAIMLTDASGVMTAGDIGTVYGRLVGVGFKPGDLDTGADLTVTDKQTGATIFSLGNAGTSARWIRPRDIGVTKAGVADTPGAGYDVLDIYVAGTLQLAVAQGGNVKTGELFLVFDEAAA